MEVFIDGGIRRGTDVIKALCLGAKAVGLGRPFLYANAVWGEDGVRRCVQSEPMAVHCFARRVLMYAGGSYEGRDRDRYAVIGRYEDRGFEARACEVYGAGTCTLDLLARSVILDL